MSVNSFIKYNICDKSGCGFDTDHYIYWPNVDEEDDLDIRYHILTCYESWTNYADSYSLQIKKVEKPSKEWLDNKIQEVEQQYKTLDGTLQELLKLQNEKTSYENI